ncbi:MULTISPECIES: S41 family peptidase [Sphingobacterium]|uniref:S41 family peptidase n=1 Tax=Sphingobacterium TaxID=28453 RepID=UPI00257E8E3D|nr:MULTISPECIES: S41 family peptidase [Sphingobacterium]
MNLAPLKQTGRLTILALTGLLVLSCKKDTPKPEPEPEPVERTEAQLIKDDIYKYYKLYSLWDKSIPDYTSDPSKFTDQYNSADAVLAALKAFTPAHAAYKERVLDRFSYMVGLDGYNTGARASSRLMMDTNDGYGIYNSFGTEDGKTAYPIIYFVEGGSPAQLAGLKRSDYITAVGNDSNYSLAVTCVGEDCSFNEDERDKIQNKLETALNAGTLNLQIKHQDGTTVSKNLTYANGYIIDPIYKDTVYTHNGTNVGYLALSSFEEIKGSATNKKNMDDAFTKFQNANIKSLIVDLRYNGGGYVESSAYVADKIAGTIGADKRLMLTYDVNEYIKKDAQLSQEFANTYFSGSSSLNLKKVYFLVSEGTASAAEMLINVLKPHLTVQVIASSSRTFGKPVGFFEEVIRNKVSFWPVSFMLRNSKGVSEYWNGLVPDISNIKDYVFVDVGDKTETMLATALNDAAPGITTKASIKAVSRKGYRLLNQGEVNTRPERGMIKKR